MNLKNFFPVLALILSLAPIARAAESENSARYDDDVRSDRTLTSEENRENKRFTITAQPIGSAVAGVPSLGVNVGYFITPDLLIQAEYTDGKNSEGFYDIEAQTLALDLKYFVGNSFYVKGGLAERKLAIDNVLCILCSAQDQSALSNFGNADSLALEVAIGNEWQWRYFTLGCDWFGVMKPIATLGSTSTSIAGTDLSPSDQSDINNEWAKVANTTSYELLRFYLGASF